MTDPILDGQKTLKPLFDKRALMVGAVLGGCVAPAILLIINYQNSPRKENIKKALLLIGLLNVLVFGSILAPVDSFPNRIPDAVFGLVILSAVYAIIVFFVSQDLQAHAQQGGTFYSAWGAAGIAIAASGVVVGASYLYMSQLSFDTKTYDSAMNQFSINEQKSFEVYDLMERGQFIEASIFVEDEAIPAWEANINLTDTVASIKDLPKNYIEYNNVLKEYCSLRLESLDVIDEYLTNPTEQTRWHVDLIHSEIDQILKRLDELSR
ncbi:MAG: hypothetical protein HWD92_07535 [Flavobacteriia bacterium]|nr:hypothetical protein [Flavobacteriia bacterium]